MDSMPSVRLRSFVVYLEACRGIRCSMSKCSYGPCPRVGCLASAEGDYDER